MLLFAGFCVILGIVVKVISGEGMWVFWLVSVGFFILGLPGCIVGGFIGRRNDFIHRENEYIQDREDYREMMRQIEEDDRMDRYLAKLDELDDYDDDDDDDDDDDSFNFYIDNRQIHFHNHNGTNSRSRDEKGRFIAKGKKSK